MAGKHWAAVYDIGADEFVIVPVKQESADKIRAFAPGYRGAHLLRSPEVEVWIEDNSPEKLKSEMWNGRDAFVAPSGWLNWKEAAD